MKKFLVLIYIAIVATLSINARANEHSLLLSDLHFDKDLQVLEVAGHFPVPCVNQAEFRITELAPQIVELEFFGQSQSEVCIQIVGGDFSMAIDSSALKHELLRSGLNGNGEYRILVAGGELDFTVDFSQVLPRPFATKALQGRVELSESGPVLVTSRGAIQLMSPVFDISMLNGMSVQALGHLNTKGIVNDDLFLSKKRDPQFILTGFSFLVLN